MGISNIIARPAMLQECLNPEYYIARLSRRRWWILLWRIVKQRRLRIFMVSHVRLFTIGLNK